MHDFKLTVVHKACDQPAKLTYYEHVEWVYDGNQELPEYRNVLTLYCKTCTTYVEVEPVRR